jgi:hypothetical protein
MNEQFNFANGSTIYLKGKNAGNAATQIIMNMNSADWDLLDSFGGNDTSAGASFEVTLSIDATEAAIIADTTGEHNFAGLSFRGNNAGAVIVLEQLQIKNSSGTVIFDLAQVLSGLSVGQSNFPSIFNHAGFQNAGSMTFSVINLP